MSDKYDFIVIGSGPAAVNFSRNIFQAGKSVLVVENDRFGGTCPNYGCEPKIYLEGAVRNVLMSQNLLGQGLSQESKINWAALMKSKKQAFTHTSQASEKDFQSMGIDTIYGTAHFLNNQTIQINDKTYTASKIVIATGERANKLKIPGREYTHDSNDILDLEELPEHVVFIGGGVVSMELATVMAAAGAKVDIIEYAERPLLAFSRKHVLTTLEVMKKRGINFHFNQGVTSVNKRGAKFIVETSTGMQIAVDYVVDASGRVANLDQLGLENTDVQYSSKGIVVNSHLQTHVKNIFALGDVLDKTQPHLVPTAQFEAEYLVNQFLTGESQPITYPIIGMSVFTFPQVAQVGVSVDMARQNHDYSVVDIDNLWKTDMEYRGVNDQHASLSLVYNQKDELVGAAESSQSAVNDINGFIPLIGLKVTKEQMKENYQLIFPAIAYKTRFNLK